MSLSFFVKFVVGDILCYGINKLWVGLVNKGNNRKMNLSVHPFNDTYF